MIKRDFVALEDSQRRLLRAAYLPEDVVSTDVPHPITVSTFYAIMDSAPHLPSQKAIDALQPEALLPTLLPFQRRSVAWLLEKEGMSVTADGSIVPRESSSSFSFWEEVMEGNRRWFLNRLSGELSEDEPELPTILGGMLAEEPGLGKTVETIALILLNPAPPKWNPSLSRWDPISRLDVKAVKVYFLLFSFRERFSNLSCSQHSLSRHQLWHLSGRRS
jgi:E3 ubiquitin-protein ligase SHPRH